MLGVRFFVVCAATAPRKELQAVETASDGAACRSRRRKGDQSEVAIFQ